MNIKTLISIGKYGLRGKKSNEYVEKRYSELINKNYTSQQVQEMLYFELGLKTTAEISLKNASKGACFSAGADVGAGVGATIGSAIPGAVLPVAL